MSISVAKFALVVLGLAASVVYASNMMTMPVIVGVALVGGLGLVNVPSPRDATRIPPKVAVVTAFVIAALGLVIAWATFAHREDHAWRVLNDLGWAEAGVGAWLAYSSMLSLGSPRLGFMPFDAAAEARWREGELRFGVELARRIVVRAQPSWAALVVETAWPEPRPELVTRLLQNATNATLTELAALHEEMAGKSGVGEVGEARWELARIACGVMKDVLQRDDPNDVGGPDVARFVVAAAQTVRDDDDAKRIFAAIVLPAVARRA